MKRAGFLILGAFLFWSCARHGAPEVLGERQFAAFYVQLTRAGLSVRDAGSDTGRAHARANDVLRRAGISRAEVEATVRWYNEDVTRWRGLFDEIMKIAADSLAR